MISDSDDKGSYAKEQQPSIPPTEEAWSVPVPEDDQNPPDLYTDSLDQQGDEMDTDSEDTEMPRPVEAWTDELADEDAVAADETGFIAEDEAEAISKAEFPEPIETWSIPGDPKQTEEE